MIPIERGAHPFAMDSSGALPNGRAFQLIVEGQPSLGRVPPHGVTVDMGAVPDRLARQTELARLAPGMEPSGWSVQLTPRYGSERWSGRDVTVTPRPVYAQSAEGTHPGSGQSMPVRYTEVYGLTLDRSGALTALYRQLRHAIPTEVANANVALPPNGSDFYWDTLPAKQAGKLGHVATVGTFVPDPESAFLVHARVDDAAGTPAGKPRPLVIQAMGTPVPTDVNPEADTPAPPEWRTPPEPASPTVELPPGVTIGFTAPNGEPMSGTGIGENWPHPYVSVARDADTVEAKFGSTKAVWDEPRTLFGSDAPGRIGNLVLNKENGLANPPYSQGPYTYFAQGNAMATVAAATQDADVMTVRAGHTATLGAAIQLAQKLGYRDILVHADRAPTRVPTHHDTGGHRTEGNQPAGTYGTRSWTV